MKRVLLKAESRTISVVDCDVQSIYAVKTIADDEIYILRSKSYKTGGYMWMATSDLFTVGSSVANIYDFSDALRWAIDHGEVHQFESFEEFAAWYADTRLVL